MHNNKFMSAAQAAALIKDGDTVGLMGGGGGLMEATCLFEAVQARFKSTQQPRHLTLIHALGIGDKKTKGMNCFAHEGLVRKVIGGHWVWSPAMQRLAEEEKIEAYILPGGVSSQLMREIGAGRPGLSVDWADLADGAAAAATIERPEAGRSRPPPAGIKQSGKATFA